MTPLGYCRLRRRARLQDAAAVLAVACGLYSPAAGAPTDPHVDVTVAILRDAEPFSYQGDDGVWTGLAVEMWKRVAVELGLVTRFEGKDRAGLLDAVQNGQARFGIGPISITADRLDRLDFSVPIYASGVAVAVRRARHGPLVEILLDAVLSATFLRFVVALVVVAI